MYTGACFAEDILLYVHIRVITVSEAEIAVIDIVIDIAIQWNQILHVASFGLVSKSHLARERAVKEMPPLYTGILLRYSDRRVSMRKGKVAHRKFKSLLYTSFSKDDLIIQLVYIRLKNGVIPHCSIAPRPLNLAT